MKYRIEKDSIGEVHVPENALYGAQTQRALHNFKISHTITDRDLVLGLAEVKKAAAIANYKVGNLSEKITQAMVFACDEILDGKHFNEFVTDRIQGGAGTSVNMNANEVIANIATLHLGGKIGEYTVHPNDHVNRGQSTNDIFPTAAKVAAMHKVLKLKAEIKAVQRTLAEKGKEFKDVMKLGRTHLQDAVPVSVGATLKAWSHSMDRDIKRIEAAISDLLVINMGATAIGTGITNKVEYVQEVTKEMCNITGYKFEAAKNMIDGTRHTDGFVALSSAMKTMATTLSKNCNDLRLGASGPKGGLGEYILPQMQPGSSIMPGKVNPVIPEVVSQICFQVFGNDVAINFASEGGQFELNVFEPVIFKNLFESLEFLTNGLQTLRINCLEGLQVNRENIEKNISESAAYATVFAPDYGYDKVSKIVKAALKSNSNVKEALKSGLGLSQEQFDDIACIKNVCPIQN